MGGSRGAAFANTFQTIVFMIMGLVAFTFIINALGGINNAGNVPARINEKGLIVQDYRFDKKEGILKENSPPKPIGRVVESESSNLTNKQPHFWREPVVAEFKKKNPKTGELVPFERELGIPFITFVTYLFYSLERGNVSPSFPTLVDGS